jgi:hypothetical protein
LKGIKVEKETEKENALQILFPSESAFITSLRHSRSLVVFFLVAVLVIGSFFGFLIYMASQNG